MGGVRSSRKSKSSGPGLSAYWDKMTPEQRSAEMVRRASLRKKNWLKKKRRREQPSTESPFPPELLNKPQITTVHRSLRNIISDLNTITEELKALFEF
jgi:hypothetical protein